MHWKTNNFARRQVFFVSLVAVKHKTSGSRACASDRPIWARDESTNGGYKLQNKLGDFAVSSKSGNIYARDTNRMRRAGAKMQGAGAYVFSYIFLVHPMVNISEVWRL